MSKRFTASEKWSDPWFCSLSERNRLFWMYVLDNCDLAGIWQANWPLVNFYFPEFTYDDQAFKGRLIEVRPGKFFIPKFITFQYGDLNPNNRLHQAVMSRMEKEGVSKDHLSPFQGAKDKDKNTLKSLSLRREGKSAEKGGDPNFDRFWEAYPKKRSKGQAERAWSKLNPSSEQVERILESLGRAKTLSDWTKDSGQFIPHPATWLNAKGWEDDVSVSPLADAEVTRLKEAEERANRVVESYRNRASQAVRSPG